MRETVSVLARRVLTDLVMTTVAPRDGWTIPLMVLEWTTILVGLIMMLAVMLMH